MAKSDKQARLPELPEDLRVLLGEIEKEPVPERLLELARELQRALTACKEGGIFMGDRRAARH
ncbi:hypothetical protein [Nitratireductor sp. ZSWI3]|uniref:hypothetical protein n=1 Tax=Nitratireductor sp. ZSWI3 TaxID=2966359 RepID=UPI00214FAD12|nr:hypothetical protein [Nitratireductor sp. ZSWI3]MCR4264666.1 hypothetical protein [Nitratireductor sp. ZSWI3]